MNIERYQDINISDNIFKNEYSAKYISSQYSSAYNILDNNSQLNSKKFVAEVINTISDILYSLEEDYYSNTNDYFDNLTDDLQDVIDNYKYIGDWSNSTIYRKYNIVTYSDKYYITRDGVMFESAFDPIEYKDSRVYIETDLKLPEEVIQSRQEIK